MSRYKTYKEAMSNSEAKLQKQLFKYVVGGDEFFRWVPIEALCYPEFHARYEEVGRNKRYITLRYIWHVYE